MSWHEAVHQSPTAALVEIDQFEFSLHLTVMTFHIWRVAWQLQQPVASGISGNKYLGKQSSHISTVCISEQWEAYYCSITAFTSVSRRC